MHSNRTGRTMRQVLIGVLMAMVVVALIGAATPTQAQTVSHKIRIGDTVNGTLDAKTFAQVYSFDAAQGDKVTITATASTKSLLLALMLTDSTGQSLSQVAALTRPDVSITGFTF